VLPRASAAEHATVVVPIAKVLPDTGEQTAGRLPSTRSDADAEKATVAPEGVVAVAVMFAGTVNTGAV
jgi:hypothetical protein